MENRNETSLDDVLDAFVSEYDRPTSENLREWVKRYPHFRPDLVEFAAVWAEQLVLPRAPEIGPETENVLIDRAMSHVHNVAYGQEAQRREQADNDESIVSLMAEAQRAGMNAQQFAEACDLDIALVSKLNSRQLEPESIPPKLTNRVARLLQRPVAVIAAYFAKSPQAVSGRAFLSRGKPEGAARQSFADAVRSSSLSDEEKARWLAEGTV